MGSHGMVNHGQSEAAIFICGQAGRPSHNSSHVYFDIAWIVQVHDGGLCINIQLWSDMSTMPRQQGPAMSGQLVLAKSNHVYHASTSVESWSACEVLLGLLTSNHYQLSYMFIQVQLLVPMSIHELPPWSAMPTNVQPWQAIKSHPFLASHSVLYENDLVYPPIL